MTCVFLQETAHLLEVGPRMHAHALDWQVFESDQILCTCCNPPLKWALSSLLSFEGPPIVDRWRAKLRLASERDLMHQVGKQYATYRQFKYHMGLMQAADALHQECMAFLCSQLPKEIHADLDAAGAAASHPPKAFEGVDMGGSTTTTAGVPNLQDGAALIHGYPGGLAGKDTVACSGRVQGLLWSCTCITSLIVLTHLDIDNLLSKYLCQASWRTFSLANNTVKHQAHLPCRW